MKIDLYVHSTKEASYDAGKKAGLSGEALERFKFAGYEHKITYLVDKEGHAFAIAIDDRRIAQ